MKNFTGLKSFDLLENDPRVAEVHSEGSDGYWLELAPPWDYEWHISIHGTTVRETLAQLRWAEKLTPAEYGRRHG